MRLRCASASPSPSVCLPIRQFEEVASDLQSSWLPGLLDPAVASAPQSTWPLELLEQAVAIAPALGSLAARGFGRLGSSRTHSPGTGRATVLRAAAMELTLALLAPYFRIAKILYFQQQLTE